MQGCLSYRKASDAERHIFVSDGKSVEVEETGHFRSLNTTLNRTTPDTISSWVPTVITVSLPHTSQSTSSLPSDESSQGLSPCGVPSSTMHTASHQCPMPLVIAAIDLLPIDTAAAPDSLSSPTAAVPSRSAASSLPTSRSVIPTISADTTGSVPL
ncbi:hypothetical protein LWI28_024924 [Acer negundo]|uniref:Uncharacterized protein n=1 Tax=Acer negundo TaxID=4023 RepID=A0AAD5NFL8_ACENE|nr:hypothetical protein LWI28_024924 [Acer negundo]